MTKAPTADTPLYYFQSWDSIELEWNQAKCKAGAVVNMSCKSVRKSLFVPVVSDAPERWAKHTGIEKFKFWKPCFHLYSSLNIHPKSYETFWLILLHSLH